MNRSISTFPTTLFPKQSSTNLLLSPVKLEDSSMHFFPYQCKHIDRNKVLAIVLFQFSYFQSLKR